VRPLIGISFGPIDPDPALPLARDALNRAYTDAVWAAGGIPLGLAPAPAHRIGELLAAVDGLILTGGWDVDPSLYGEVAAAEVGRLWPDRDRFEIALALAALNDRLPLLAICRGCQVLNVALGGTLVQHLPHHPSREVDTRHEVKLEPGSALAGLLGCEVVSVNSIHHQSVDRPGTGVRPVAWAGDGAVEAFEVEDHPEVRAVQWHPELTADTPHSRSIFTELVARAAAFSA
jgi:gamma-glutamyl-gamma-aminobutyrate hydrolase PuuD